MDRKFLNFDDFYLTKGFKIEVYVIKTLIIKPDICYFLIWIEDKLINI